MSVKYRISGFIILSILCTFIFGVNAFAAGWQQDEYGWWYENEDGTYPCGGICEIEGNLYAFDEDGYLYTNTWV